MKKQQKELQLRPNARLTGSSFDAKHLDKFLQTEYGDKGVYPVPASPLLTKGGSGKAAAGDNQGGFQQKIIPVQTNVRYKLSSDL